MSQQAPQADCAPAWTEVGPHAMSPSATHDEIARFNFLANFNKYMANVVVAGNEVAYESRARPAYRREHGHDPSDRHEIRAAMRGDPYYQMWSALRRIGWGRTRSYGQVARAIGQPNAARAVGTACGANPIPVFVPCHRVLAADRRLGGFSGGLDWKRALLRREGVQWRGDGQNPDAGRP